jgi:deoxyribonuclease-4
MVFDNDRVRIGPPAVQDALFMMPNAAGKLRKGKRFEIPEYLAKMGLYAFEFSAGRMASFTNTPDISKLAENSKKFDVTMSIHAPYYISLTSESPETYETSIVRLANVYEWAVWLNAKRIVLHPGTYVKGQSPEKLKKMIIEGITRGLALADEKYPDHKSDFRNVCLCAETMGKQGQLGPTEEILEICQAVGTDRCRPCIDFGHLYARNTGKHDGRKFYLKELEAVENGLGKSVLQHLHIHYSHIEFTPKGEKDHVPNTNKKFGPAIEPLFELILENKWTPIIINESPDLEPDAKLLMDLFQKMQAASKQN